MIKDGLVQQVQSLQPAELLKLSKQELEDLFGNTFAMMKGYSQNNPHHCYDLLEHTVKTLEALDCSGLCEIESQELLIAAMFHDVGKPLVAFEKMGRTVFYNHAVKSKEIAQQELSGVDLGSCSLERILFYIEHHDDFISFKAKADVDNKKNPFIVPITLKSVFGKIVKTQDTAINRGEYMPTFYDYALLMRLCVADAKAQSPKVFVDGKIVDSLEQKLSRLNAIASYIQLIISAENECCDLHTHSVFSDGTDTPQELVKKAHKLGLRAVALTDHNTISGLDEFIKAAKKYEIDAVPGVEFSTEYEDCELHVVGLFINKASYRKINCFLNKAVEAKAASNRLLIENLRKDGYDVSYDELIEYATNSNINRAVIGQYLHSKGIITTVEEGFKTILSKKCGYYIPPKRPSTIETIRFIKSIGALPVLAHPLLDLSPDKLERFLPTALSAGLGAIEVQYSLFSNEQKEYLHKIAREHQIYSSGGSDYHGTGKPNISLGTGTGDLAVSLSTYLDLVKNFNLDFS